MAWLLYAGNLAAAEPVATQNSAVAPVALAVETNRFNVQAYVVEGKMLLSSNSLTHAFARHPAGTNVSLDEIVRAAADLQLEYQNQGYATMNIVIAPKRIKDGIVTLGVFPGAVPQIVVGGIHYSVSSNGVVVSVHPPFAEPVSPPVSLIAAADAATNSPSAKSEAATNASPHFTVAKYLVMGNSVLPPAVIGKTLTNVAGAFGTNVTFDGLRSAAGSLQGAYRERGYVTVSVGIPQQKLDSNQPTVKLQVTEGRLAAINVKGNHYFSSNNVMRTLPSLHTNTVLNGLIFQAELNQANANQDRQIYPVIGPGAEPGTSDLSLKVKDRLPVHAKVDFNNQHSPDTPDQRLNTSVVYNNLWQQEHALGLQYGFSPQQYKPGGDWNFYDQPAVANYSAFYRMPLGNLQSLENTISSRPGSFGYNEATRKFELPSPSGQPDLTFFASRSTIDNGVATSPNENIYTTRNTDPDGNVTTNNSLDKMEASQTTTVNNSLGFRLNLPLAASADFHSGLSSGLDYKTYESTSYKTNIFTLSSVIVDNLTRPPQTNHYSSEVITPVPKVITKVDYLPVLLRYDVGWRDFLGTATLGLGLNVNLWYDATVTTGDGTNSIQISGQKALQYSTGSTESSGHWVILNPSFSHQFQPFTNWITTIRADGQWASEPLISNEQFGAGGVNSVRGYQEGEVFGDTGWHVSLEQQTPPHVIGMVHGNLPLTVRGSVYMDYARVYLLDSTRGQSTKEDDLWGTGFGTVASVGSHWEARMLFSLPLLQTVYTSPYRPFFNFSLTAQF